MKNYIEAGNTMDWHNSTAKDVVSGQIVAVKDTFGIASAKIAAGEAGVLLTAGVFELPKDAVEILQGKAVNFADGKVTTAAGGQPIGKAWKLAAVTDSTCWVRLGA